jgi:hypothetical protein
VTGISNYQVFGLRIRSEIPLPELFPADGNSEADVVIRRGSAGTAESEPGLQADDDALLLTIPQVGRYRIAHGREILVEPDPDVADRNVRLYLLGSAFGALLHQRGVLPLHANAVEIDGKAVAFMGEAGAGKSTLAAWFHDRGFRIIADDVCVVGFDDCGEPYAAPGLPRLRLWAEALALMGRDAVGLERSYVGADEEKYDVPIAPARAAQTEIPLAALYLLDRGEHLSIAPLTGVEAADAVFANTYRGAYVVAVNGHRRHWQASLVLVRSLPVFRAEREWNPMKLDEQCRLILDHASAVVLQADSDLGAP